MRGKAGFTLMEMLVVIAIIGLVAVMVWPVRNVLDDSQRARATHDGIDEIRRSILGHEQEVDSYDMGRIIGGYVGDMGEWPGLWEPDGDGTGGLRGEFFGKAFRWNKPYRQVADAGLESMGQPRGLWTRYLSEDGAAELSPDDWRGPYLTPPVTRNSALGRQYAANQQEYESLSPSDRRYFHLLQGEGQLTDGWNRSFRFFITDDPDSDENETIFWIVSPGPDGRATFPASPDDMNDYDENAPGNEDNIISMLHERDWLEIYRNQGLRSSSTTRLVILAEDRMEGIVRSLIGEGPTGTNTGYTGDLLEWPGLWNWICRDEGDNMIDCGDPEAVPGSGQWEDQWKDPLGHDPDRPFTFGQPRGLWDQGDLESSRFGVGWRHAYIQAPDGAQENELLLDPWNRPYRFFKVLEEVNGNDVEQMLILSGGPSGAFEFPEDSGVPSLEDRTGEFSLVDYDPTLDANQDNIVRIVRRNEWQPGYLRIETLKVENVPGHPHDNIKCRLFGVHDEDSERDDPVLIAGTHGEISGITPWTVGSEALPVFQYDDTTSNRILTGARYLVCWKDADEDDVPDSGETGWWRVFSLFGHPAKAVYVEELVLDANEFEALP